MSSKPQCKNCAHYSKEDHEWGLCCLPFPLPKGTLAKSSCGDFKPKKGKLNE